jgi:Na+/H+ antiporter NhaD/arsenite permease-like protein
MKRHETIIVLFTFAMAVLIPILGAIQLGDPDSLFKSTLKYWAPAYVTTSILTLYYLINDLYKRDFEKSNSKVTWAIIMFFTGGIGLIIYAFKHAIKPRPTNGDA